jgi:putative DNA primase/helicase
LAILNSGHHRDGASVLRCDGENNEPKSFSTWSAVVVGSIGSLSSTLESRSIVIDIFRKRRDEKVARVHPADRQRLRELANRAALWAKDHREGLSNAAPELPDCLYNRDQDNWRPLIAIADAAGGHWPQTVRRVAIGMNGRNEDPSEGVMLLADIRRIFNGKNSDRLTTENLLIALCADAERPWCEYDRGGRITTRQLAGLLKMFGIRSSSVRIGDKTPKGYKRARFEDAFGRYLSP